MITSFETINPVGKMVINDECCIN